MTNKLNKMTSPWTLVILSVGFIMAVLDTTGVVLAVPTIEAELHIALNDSIWILNSYILALSSLLLVSGNLARKFGAKRLFITGMIFLFWLLLVLESLQIFGRWYSLDYFKVLVLLCLCLVL